MLIETDRLRIRPVRLSDAAETAMLMTPAVAINLVSWRAPMSVEDAKARIRTSRSEARERTALSLAIVAKASDALLGWIGVFRSSAPPEFQLGYWLGEDHQTHGYMVEALTACLPVVMRHFGIDSIIAECFEDNVASIHVLERIGMNRFGRGAATSSARPGPMPTIRFRFAMKADR